jgi:DNA repair protein RadC
MMDQTISQFAIKYELRKIINRELLVDPSMDFRSPKVCASFLHHLQYLPNEKHFCLFLDHAGRCLGTLEYSGSETAVMYPISEVMSCAILSGARLVVFVHNHPTHLIDGELEFSKEDIEVIAQFTWMLGVFGIKLHDSILISSDRFTSYQMQLEEKIRRDKMSAYERGDLVLLSAEIEIEEGHGILQTEPDTTMHRVL